MDPLHELAVGGSGSGSIFSLQCRSCTITESMCSVRKVKEWKGIKMADIGSVKAESAMCPRIDAVEWLQDVYDIAKSWGLDLMS